MKYLVLLLVLVIATPAFGLKATAYKMVEDFGTHPPHDCALQYYYYIPCPTYSWFWAFSNWSPGDLVFVCYNIGDEGTGGFPICDPYNCHELNHIRVLDFAGYGVYYPGQYTVEFDVWCGLMYYHLWNSGPWETDYGWNYIPVDPSLCLTPCLDYSEFCVFVTATHTGTDGRYPAWGCDNISKAIADGCVMHDIGCLPALYPRGAPECCGVKFGPGHSGYCPGGICTPPLMGFCDGADTTCGPGGGGTQFGYLELAWRIYLDCTGFTATESTKWGAIKSMYR